MRPTLDAKLTIQRRRTTQLSSLHRDEQYAAGLATFQVRGRSRYFERDGLFLSVTAQTTGAAAQLFVAKDQIDSYVDPKGLLPYRTVMNLVGGPATSE